METLKSRIFAHDLDTTENSNLLWSIWESHLSYLWRVNRQLTRSLEAIYWQQAQIIFVTEDPVALTTYIVCSALLINLFTDLFHGGNTSTNTWNLMMSLTKEKFTWDFEGNSRKLSTIGCATKQENWTNCLFMFVRLENREIWSINSFKIGRELVLSHILLIMMSYSCCCHRWNNSPKKTLKLTKS